MASVNNVETFKMALAKTFKDAVVNFRMAADGTTTTNDQTHSDVTRVCITHCRRPAELAAKNF